MPNRTCMALLMAFTPLHGRLGWVEEQVAAGQTPTTAQLRQYMGQLERDVARLSQWWAGRGAVKVKAV
eukprot:SAG11_NODE_3984_length_2121_cov_1.696340_1_plen_67_part_10